MVGETKAISHPLRLLGIGVSNLSQINKKQLSLFEQKENDRQADLSQTIDEIKDQFGENSILRARSLVYLCDKNQKANKK